MAEKWIDKKGFLSGYVKPRAERVRKDEPAVHGVPFYPIRCPQCKSKNHKCYATKLPVRYHVCRDCGFNFKSTEIDGE